MMGWSHAIAAGAALFCAGQAIVSTLIAIKYDQGPLLPTILWAIAAAVLAVALS